MNFAIFLMIAGASARHVLDGFDKQSDMENSGYSDRGEPGDNIIANRFSQSVKERSEVSNDSLNNISDENDYRLRTNAFTTEVYGPTERINQGDVYSNTRSVKINDGKQNRDQRKPCQGGKIFIGGTVPIRPDAKQIPNKPIHHKSRAEAAVNQNTERGVLAPTVHRPENRFANNSQERIPVKTNVNKQNQNNTNITDSYHSNEPADTVVVKPEVKNDRDSPNKNETEIHDDEQIWIWGTEKTKLPLDPGSLDDRAAFSGDKCPTGKAKINGVCVEKD